ncbi:Msta_ isoform A [Caligus rogercresseyi]|uniref:Msta_ isoform A n=1 Tax=Caligus rogercresseyi TaxID=217165 RepID=A0A7T8HGV6_CALRO|nr:Msta_ isoform A [Caligus rogercresseyi]
MRTSPFVLRHIKIFTLEVKSVFRTKYLISCRDHGIICDHLRAFQLTPRQLEDICSSSTLHTILPLKLILSKESNPPVYNSLLSLMDHRDSRLEDTEYMEGIQGPVLDPLIKALFSQKSRMNKEDIMRALGIVEVNSYEIFNATGSTGFRGLYCLTSLLSHDCTPNARPVMTQKDPYECRLIASRDIQTGEVININYVHPQKPNRIRKRILKENWYFECFCRRCGDDSEFGLHPDALRCACHLKGLLLPSSKESYECNKCGQIKSLKYVEDLIEDLERRKGSIDRADVQSYLELLQRSSKVLSPNHYFLNALQRWIIPLYCRPLAVNPELQPTSEMLKEKLRLCENYLNRGKVLYEWAEASLRLGGKGNLASMVLPWKTAPSFEHRLSQAACHALKLVNEMMENKEDTYL